MKEITSTVKIVKELFANTKYNLDYYQREYVWKTRQVKDLTGRSFRRNSQAITKKSHERREVGNYTHYFLGSDHHL